MGVISSLGEVVGVPTIDRSSCNLCGACTRACPVGVLTLQGQRIGIDNQVVFGCIACGHCMMVCPQDCIRVTGRKLSPENLTGLPPKEELASPQALEALLLSRRSMRKFRDQEVPRDVIERILAAAATAPMGIPPWEVGVVVFGSPQKVQELAQDTAETYSGLLRLMDRRPILDLLRLFMKRSKYDQWRSFILPLGRKIVEDRAAGVDSALYHAPAALLFHVTPYADEADAAIACTYASLAAESLGLGSCMIGCVAPPLARRKDKLKKYGIPAGNRPAIVLILGYPAITYHRALRRSFCHIQEY